MTLDTDSAAKVMKEMGHPTRLAIFKRVARAGYQGLPVGQLQSHLDIPGSTLSHHIASLVSAGVLEQRRESRTLYCTARFERLQALIDFLQEECCLDETGG